MALREADAAGFLKMGLLGFGGTGKTHTAMEVAIGLREFLGLSGPIAMFDTEMGSDHWGKRVRARTGRSLLVEKKRSMPDLLTFMREAFEADAAVAIVDSISHVWEEVQRSYLRDLQEAQRKAGRRPTTRLEFQDWNQIKATWSEWTAAFLNVPMHLIVCGRAGYAYDFEENERGKKELVKTGIKMKAEADFGYEPSLLVEMSRAMDPQTHELTISAFVIKDRQDLLNGREFQAPTFEHFRPHVAELNPAAHAPVDTTGRTTFHVNEGGRNVQKEEREILAEKIQHELVLRWPSPNGSDDKTARAAAMAQHFGTGSWKEITERLPLEMMRRGLDALAASAKPDRSP